jgi:hypothetical protein
MTRADQKEIERRMIEWVRGKSTLIPSGELQPFENPDWLIPSAALAVEVSFLLPEKPDQALFSGPQLSRFQESVVDTAEQIYRELAGPGPLDVLVHFTNDWTRKRDAKQMGRALAQFVRINYPSDGKTVVLDETTPDGFALVRIACIEGGWGTGSVNSTAFVTYEQLKASILAKDNRVHEYRTRIPHGWQLCLLFGTSPSVLWSVSVPKEVTAWRFACGFDRVLLSSWEHGVLELNTCEMGESWETRNGQR